MNQQQMTEQQMTEQERFAKWYAKKYGIPAESVLQQLNARGLLGRVFDAFEAWKSRVPDGYVLVPIEPTQDMLNAGHVIMNPVKGSDVHAGTNTKRRECYKAMIAAANSAKFLVDISEHLIEVNDRSSVFNTTLHVIKDTEQYKAGATIFIHVFEDVNGFDRPSLTEWRDGQHIRTNILN